MNRILIFACLFLVGQTTHSLARNILLFTVDSCRADRIGTYGHQNATTPRIDGWARTGTVFENAYSVSAWTAPGLVSLLSGLYPPAHTVNNRDQMGSNALPTLPRLLEASGYKVPNLNFFTFAPYYTRLGLPAIDRSYFGAGEGDELLNWLTENAGTADSQPFFVWYHTTMVHQPYNPSPSDLPAPRAELQKSPGIKAVMNGAIVPIGSTQFSEEDQATINLLYDAEIRRMDRLFGAALDALEEGGVLEDTLVIFTADHGEELLDHGFVGHSSTSLQAKLYEELIRIPMIFAWPGRVPANQRISTRVSQIDLLPTTMGLLKMAVPDGIHGLDLFSGQIPDRTLFFESVISGNQTTKEHEDIWVRAILKGDHKYISNEELYNLRTDPKERANLIESETQLATDLRKELATWVSRTKPPSRSHLEAESDVFDSSKEAQCPVVYTPENNSTLTYDQHTGAILIDWSGNKNADYLIEYSIGTGDHHVAGVFQVHGNHQVMGPLGKELWKNLQAWNPFKIRISPRKAQPCWSEWISFRF